MKLRFLNKIQGVAIGLFISTAALAQQVSSSITSWKNNTKGAYSIIHDDFGSSNMSGIQNYADTIASNRNLKFTFGVITGVTDSWEYQRATQMITQHKHEVINHSHSHYCLNRHPNCTWEDQFYWAEDDFERELSQSTTYIKQNTTYTPRFFIYPFDVGSNAANKYLKNLGYIGSRTGTKDLVGLNSNNFGFANGFNDPQQFYKTNFIVLDNGVQSTLEHMNKVVTDAINNNSWGNRELHNVGYLGHSRSWGEIATDMYRSHLNFVKQKVDAGDLWMATVSEVLTYQTQKNAYNPTANYSQAQNEITVTWNNPSLNVANYLSPLQVKSPITLEVDVTKIANQNNISVEQNLNPITDFWIKNNKAYINVYPHEGNVVIKSTGGNQGCQTICITVEPKDVTVIETNNIVLNIEAESNQTISYQWYKGTTKLDGQTSSTLIIPYAQNENAGNYYVQMTNSLGTVQSNTITVTIEDDGQVPFDEWIAIPGRLEAENYDRGGQGISYFDITSENQGLSPYRSDAVDVESISDASDLGIGYIVKGEWLEYSIDVASQGVYTLSFRTASATQDDGRVKLYIDGEEVTEVTNLLKTNGWDDWNTIVSSNISLPAGKHILRLEFTASDFNLNYIDFKLDEVTNTIQNIEQSVTQIYPNPFTDDLKVRFVQTPNSVTVLDILGNIKERHDLNGDEFELVLASEVPSGIYMVQLSYDDHTEIVRVIKQ